jgi:NADH:ubiquinone oxidoreductase subunit B-like Fe-S oxidoreductase
MYQSFARYLAYETYLQKNEYSNYHQAFNLKKQDNEVWCCFFRKTLFSGQDYLSLAQTSFGLACCAFEMIGALCSHYDLDRFSFSVLPSPI